MHSSPETLQTGGFSENSSPQQTKDRRWKLRTTSEQVPFNESEWAMIALHHFLEQPELRFRFKNLLMDTLLDTLRTTSRSLGASSRCPEITASECSCKEETLTISETGDYRGRVAQVDKAHGPQTRDPEFDSRSERSFAERKRAGLGPEKNSDSEKITLIALLSELPSKKNKALQEPTKASTQMELEGPLI